MSSLLTRLLPSRLPVGALDLALRLTVKRRLERLEDPAVFRARLAASARLFRDPPAARYAATMLRHAGRDLPAEWAWIDGTPEDAPVILYLHGGAYLGGSPRTHRHLAAALAGVAGARALLPDYRLAPEHTLPACLEDARLAWNWLATKGYPPERVALAGDSAGGGLALALLADLTADRAHQPGGLALFSPWADLRGTAPSIARNAEHDAMLPASRLADVVRYCIGEDGDTSDWRVSPVLARFRRPPPAIIFASMAEILLDDAIAVAEVLRQAEADPELELRARLPHAWPIFRGYLPEADEAVRRAGHFLGQHLNPDRWGP
ncbi:MAG: alpha/beta hydrolase [Pseudomonadota bacterium]